MIAAKIKSEIKFSAIDHKFIKASPKKINLALGYIPKVGLAGFEPATKRLWFGYPSPTSAGAARDYAEMIPPGNRPSTMASET
jgi:hypothetical protein